MSTDRELLELAAKAAGLFLVCYDDVNLKGIAATEIPIKNLPFGWNPLTDDGDALRLAVKLEFGPLISSNFVNIRRYYDEQSILREPLGNDPYAATRRAIVRAAAEIGKSK